MPARRPRLLGRFLPDQRGIAAVEFALVLPVMILFSMGIAEVGRFALLNLKLQHAATTLADLAARDESVSDDAMTSMLGAMDFVVRPFDLDTQGLVIVSCVGPDGGGDPTVLAQAEGGGALDETSADRERGWCGDAAGRPDSPRRREGRHRGGNVPLHAMAPGVRAGNPVAAHRLLPAAAEPPAVPSTDPGRSGRAQNSIAELALDALAERVLDQLHLGDEIGGLDQLGLGVAAGDDDVQVRAAWRPARRAPRPAAGCRSAGRC